MTGPTLWSDERIRRRGPDRFQAAISAMFERQRRKADKLLERENKWMRRLVAEEKQKAKGAGA